MRAPLRLVKSGLLLLAGFICATAQAQEADTITSAIHPITSNIPRPTIPSSVWQHELPANGDEKVSFTLSLKGENFGQLEKKMTEIAQNRGAWLSTEELKYYVAASSPDKKRVETFLVDNGIEPDSYSYDHLQGSLTVKTDAATASNMFNSTLNHYKNKRTEETKLKASSLQIPTDLQDIIINISGLTSSSKQARRSQASSQMQPRKKHDRMHRHKAHSHKHPNTHRKPKPHHNKHKHPRTKTASRSPSPTSAPTKPVNTTTEPTVESLGCDDHKLSYECIAKKYGYDDYEPAPNSEHVAVILYGQWRDSAIKKFTDAFVPKAKGYIPTKAIFGDDPTRWDNLSGDDGEGTMDTEILIGTAFPLKITAYASTMDDIGNIKSLIALPDDQRPGVVSISWGEQEEDHDKQASIDFCNQVQILAALGTTFLTATGDHGVSISLAYKCPPFRADFQSACPYAVAVGATAGFKHERAAYTEPDPDIYNGWSSGGFSNHFPTPEYQKAHVEKYLELTDHNYTQYFNANGRGFPDIAAYGNYINAADTRNFYFASGASASSPLTAGLLALVNAKCKEKGKPRIGWIHPTLYSNPEATHDIEVGGTYMCKPDDANAALGFPCKKGWDPATGMGSPRFKGLLKAFGCD